MQPNILWITTDQQRFDTLGCYGNRFVATPNLDRLAAGGVTFDSAYCQSPVCTPSRASFLTGRYPRTTRCRQNGQDIPADEVLVTRLLADAGYTCGLAGKLHLSACQPTACPTSERRIDDGYSAFEWSHHPFEPDPRHNWPANAYDLWLRQRGAEFRWQPSGVSDQVKFGPPAELHQTTWCAEMAEAFLTNCSALGRPWLFSLNCFDPHHPFDPPRELFERYLDRLDEIPLPNYVEGEQAGKNRFLAIDRDGAYHIPGYHAFSRMTDRDHRAVRAAYWAMCDLIDQAVGRLLTALERTGQLENTIVIFTSDHGELLGDHGAYLKGPYFYEPCVHVPLIMSWPGRFAPGRAGGLVELTDLAPTLLELAGLDRHPGMQGRSLAGLLAGGAPPDRFRESVYCEHYDAFASYPDTPNATMVRTDRHKLVVFHGLGEGELYDLASDPAETHNLWSDPASAAVRGELLLLMTDRMADTVDPLPARRAKY